MGLLDYADAAREKLKGLLGGMPLVQMAQGKAEMPTMGGLLASLKSMPVFSPDAGQSAYEAALNVGPMGLGKIVYHGSPHKFDKFDASKIGTGEGAQAYGHGVYLADSEGVAKGYKDTLTHYKPQHVESALVDMGISKDMANTFAQYYASVGRAGKAGVLPLDSFSKILSETHPNPAGEKFRAMLREELPKLKAAVPNIDGSLYKADLPDEWIPKMLDWDKPLSEQSDFVKQTPLIKKMLEEEADYLARYPSGGLGERLGSNVVSNLGKSKEDAAKLLREAGIPGIRYLDGGSRGKGQGSYNYVVFPGLEDQVKILERNGVPLGLLGGN